MLSRKQEQFAQNIVIHGMTLTDAYIDSYKCRVTDPATISPRASNLAKSDKIQTRLVTLRDEINKPIVQELTIDKSTIVAEVLTVARTSASDANKVRAYALVASMLGYNLNKSEITTQSTNINLSFNDLTMSELLKLANMPLVLESPVIIDGSVVDSEGSS